MRGNNTTNLFKARMPRICGLKMLEDLVNQVKSIATL